MEPEEIPRDVREFIARHVPTVGHMEALLLLRDAGERGLSATEVGRRLYVSDRQAEASLRDLTAAGLLTSAVDDSHRWRFHPARPELADQAVLAMDLYRSRLVAVTNLIHARADTPARQFAEAFHWRKDG